MGYAESRGLAAFLMSLGQSAGDYAKRKAEEDQRIREYEAQRIARQLEMGQIQRSPEAPVSITRPELMGRSVLSDIASRGGEMPGVGPRVPDPYLTASFGVHDYLSPGGGPTITTTRRPAAELSPRDEEAIIRSVFSGKGLPAGYTRKKSSMPSNAMPATYDAMGNVTSYKTHDTKEQLMQEYKADPALFASTYGDRGLELIGISAMQDTPIYWVDKNGKNLRQMGSFKAKRGTKPIVQKEGQSGFLDMDQLGNLVNGSGGGSSEKPKPDPKIAARIQDLRKQRWTDDKIKASLEEMKIDPSVYGL